MLKIRTTAGEESLELPEFEARVLRGEIPPDTQILFPVVTGERWVLARELEVFKGLYSPDRIYFTRYFNLSRFPVITTAVIAANVVVYGVMKHLEPDPSLGGDIALSMVRYGAKAPSLIVDLGESWRFLTANFVHRDTLHIAFNMFLLFNVGGALENAFRRLDYVMILLAAALGTTLLSFSGSDATSGGASGVVFGCLGGLVAFGFKYRDIIPRRYQRFFGGSVMPYVLVFLWIGWMSFGIDNWGHLGGLIGGTVATLLLRPRLLDAGVRMRRRTGLRAAMIVGTLVVVGLAGPLWQLRGPDLVRERDDEFGLEVVHPAGWRPKITLGQPSFSNHLSTSMLILTEQREAPVDLSRVADDWFTLQLDQSEHAGRIQRVRRGPPKATRVAGLDALVYQAAYETVGPASTSRGFLLEMFVFARGDIAYTLVLLAPDGRFRDYTPIFDEIVRGVRVVEPRFLRQARAGVFLDPDSADRHLRLGEAFERVGEHARAERALLDALRRAPEGLAPQLALAQLLFHQPERRADGLRILEEVRRRSPQNAEVLELLADYRLVQFDARGALEALEAARQIDPDDARLRDRVRALRRDLETSPGL